MKVQTRTDLAWEGVNQVVLACLFFGFVAWGFNNGMSNTDIVMWLTLAGSSFGITLSKIAVHVPPPSESSNE